MKGAQIDYEKYSVFMRKALSGKEMCNEDGSLNHMYFNTKKGYYWSEDNNHTLEQAILKYGLDWSTITKQAFQGKKSEVEIELRACLIFGVKDSKNIGEKELNNFRKTHSKSNKKVQNGKKN